MPEPRASYSARRASNSASTAFLSASRIWASAPDGVGSSVTNRTASMARRRSARSLIPFPSLHLDTSVFRAGPRPPLDLDLTEGLGLHELDLSFTVQLKEGQ